MLLYSSLLVLTLIHRPTSAQPTGPSTSTTNGPLLLPSGNVGTGLDAGNVGSVIGGEIVIFSDPIECSIVYFHVPTRRYSRGCDCNHDRTGVFYAPPIAKIKPPVLQQRARRSSAAPPISKAERGR